MSMQTVSKREVNANDWVLTHAVNTMIVIPRTTVQFTALRNVLQFFFVRSKADTFSQAEYSPRAHWDHKSARGPA